MGALRLCFYERAAGVYVDTWEKDYQQRRGNGLEKDRI